MAKILYSVCGVGMGHATRSIMLIKNLMRDHKIFVSSYNQAYDFLKENVGEGQKLSWFELQFGKDGYRKMRTMLYNVPKAPRIMTSNIYKLAKFSRKFKPDLIISDFDVNAVLVGELLKIPVVTISSMHIMEHIKIDLSWKDKIMYYSTEKPILAAFLPSDYIFVSYYFKPGVKVKKRQFFGPIVRDEFINARVSDGNYHLVYLNEAEIEKMLPVLRKIKDEQFLIYGIEKNQKKGNIEFCKQNHEKFYHDFLNCTSVFSHGGISLTSEAVILKKPIYSFAPKKFYERFFNGTILKKLGFGNIEETPTEKGVREFLKDVKMHREEMIKADLPSGNREILKAIRKVIEKEL